MARYVFVTGGVVSSLGKGLSSASLASLLQLRGFKVRIRKLDPYLSYIDGVGLGNNSHIRSRLLGGNMLKLNEDIIHFYIFPKRNIN